MNDATRATVVIVGATHIARMLAELAPKAGYAVCLLEPRREFLRDPARRDPALSFPIGAAMKALEGPLACCIFTRDARLIEEALQAASAKETFYLGLPSARARARWFSRRAEMPACIAPMGATLPAHNAGERAVAILAEIIAARHGRVTAA